jgi:hypothetical protein
MHSRASLQALLGDWRKHLSDWAASGRLTAAAQEALQIKGESEALKRLVDQWSEGNFTALPPVVLLPASSMPGAVGAYTIGSPTIYLNQEWLKSASQDSVMLVLTEELGHHLDGLLNEVDTEGDEGKSLSNILLRSNPPRNTGQRDKGVIILPQGEKLDAEYSAAPTLSWTQVLGPPREI